MQQTNYAQFQQPQQQPQPPMQEQQKLEPNIEYIPKKLAASQVYNHLKELRNVNIANIIGLFLVNIAAVTNLYAATGVTFIFVMYNAYFAFKGVREAQRLQNKYGIDPKKPMNKV